MSKTNLTRTTTKPNEKEPKRRRSAMMLQRRALRVPRTGLHEQAAMKLRTLIVRGDLLPGRPCIKVAGALKKWMTRPPIIRKVPPRNKGRTPVFRARV